MIRIANARHNTISRATARLWLIRAESSKEGDQLRRFYELKLDRSEHPMFVLSWTLFHTIDKDSPLYGADGRRISTTADALLVLNVGGLDDSSAQQLYARHIYSRARYPLAASLPRHHQRFAAGPLPARLHQIPRRSAGMIARRAVPVSRRR